MARIPSNYKHEFTPSLPGSRFPTLRLRLLYSSIIILRFLALWLWVVDGVRYECFDASNLAAFITDDPDFANPIKFVLGVSLSHGCVAVGFGPLLDISFGIFKRVVYGFWRWIERRHAEILRSRGRTRSQKASQRA